ncbi:MAG: hypothetical protein DWI57_00445 [Chloroflexi bacterium]|nr:MAG: hypothetical protein DWI57_00445 [Chloroflexota bacterium]
MSTLRKNPGNRRYSFVVLALLLLASVGAVHALATNSHPTLPPSPLYLPLVAGNPAPVCPPTSERIYELIPVDGQPADHPDELHGDLNLALRGHMPVSATLGLIDINGHTDGDAPQLAGIFADGRTPAFTSAHRVYDWDWTCGVDGCVSPHLTESEVSLLGLATAVTETLSFASRKDEIYAGDYKVLVLYAAENRLTLAYTRHDTVAPGYALHLESLCVDANLLALYRQANTDGRGNLPALRNGDVLGTARSAEVLVAVRDRGTFMDPRSRKDWWRGR